MKQKRIALLLSALMLFSTTAFATPGETVSQSDNNVTVVKTATDGKTSAMLIVVEKDGSIATDDDIYAIVEADKDGNGEYTFNFEMPTYINGSSSVYSDGEYDLWVKEPGLAPVKASESLVFASIENRTNLLNALRGVTTAAGLQTVIEDAAYDSALKVIGCDKATYTSLSAHTPYLAMFNDIGVANFATLTLDSFKTTYNTTLTLIGINAAAAVSDVVAPLTTLDPVFDATAYSAIADATLKTKINEYIYANKPYTSTAAFNKAYVQANALYLINEDRVDDVRATIDIYKTDLDLVGTTEYNKYLTTRSHTKADEELITRLQPGIWTVADLKTALSAAGDKGNEQQGGGQQGSQQGGYIGGGFVSTTPVVTVPSTETEKHVDNYFDDTKSVEWASAAINKMVDKGVIAKAEDRKFRPNDDVTREEYVKMLVVAAGVYDENAEVDFADVNKDAWYYRYIASAYNAGIVSGISDTHFGIGNKLTRQDMAVLSSRAYKGETKIIRDAIDFADDAQISDYAKDHITRLYQAQIISGMDSTTFSPLTTATRAQSALLLYNLFLK